jgi:hypothetical protein
MEEGSGADEGWLRLECDTVLGWDLRLLQILESGEMTVDQRSIVDTPPGINPHGFSGNVCGNPLR